MPVRGIRGAITVKVNSRSEVVGKTEQLIRKLLSANRLKKDDIASIIFSVTRDLNAEFPAVGARNLGLNYTPLLCTYEIDVPGSIKKCVRILMHVNTKKKQSNIKNVYIGGARGLRPDLRSDECGRHFIS